MALTAVETVDLVAEAGLRYSTDDEPGIRRIARGSGFQYMAADGGPISEMDRRRIRQLAIPPAWTNVWICARPNGHLQATGRDFKDRKQYRYHPDWEAARDAAKYERLADFGNGLPDLRRRVDSDLRRHGYPKVKVVALAIRLLEETMLRVGNEQYLANGTRGLTTLESHHVDVGAVRVEFEFVAKGGKRRGVAVSDRRIAGHVAALQHLPGQRLFKYLSDDGVGTVSSDDVNDYLREVMHASVTAKDFRTWGGTVTVAAALAGSMVSPGDVDTESVILDAIDAAAERLGNTRAVCRSSYVHPAIPDAYRSGELAETWRRTRGTEFLERAERTVVKVLTADQATGSR